ncbi:hypothetical protein GOODEAATRI_009541 [Goodea atripinnis]|uniref:Uncharacterized protein n=1 Tax=Goodea atripinnis TaxID=208336 RepID=A0ABV0MS04_9TELE
MLVLSKWGIILRQRTVVMDEGTVQSLNSLNDQIAQFMVTRPCSLAEEEAFIPGERDTLRKSMTLMRHLLMDAQVPPPSLNNFSCDLACNICPKESARYKIIQLVL